MSERGRHEQELPGELEVHLLHQVDVFAVLASDLDDRNVEDVHLVRADEMKEQVEGPLERGERDADLFRIAGRTEIGSLERFAHSRPIAERTPRSVSAA